MVKSLVRPGAALAFAFCLAGCLEAAPPQRIVSTFPSITETLFAIGAGDLVVGVSDYCRFPPAVIALPKVGSFSKPDPEKIALMRPDLVIIDKYAAALAERLSALKLRYLGVQLGSLADVYKMIHEIGAATGFEQRAEKLNADIRQSLETVRARNAKSGTRPSVLIVMGRTPGQLTGIIAVGRRTYLGELLEMAGGTNAIEDTPIPYPHISLETVVLRNPDVILDLSMMGKDNDPQIETRLRAPWMERHELAAVRSGMVFGRVSEPLTTPGPRVVDAVELLDRTIHRTTP